ncbi:L-lactate dehydrogenase complex protein LldG [Streptomyces sp. TLI_053]|uniref:LutC/YkgG family protein n=1 Tax=Streptomyces sp. TLI_053 TaxID=1855352 RepID=UPI00087D65D2|nr:LUD domain-containing protein [Streptomyces sp. TLI_053]SDS51800.1 L-lactate dehydrogenase complex protein LldG [Streptomyces sp. TLI_053]
MTSRDQMLERIRRALSDVPDDETPLDVVVSRSYQPSHLPDRPEAVADVLAENLADYRAVVHRCSTGQLPRALTRIWADRHTRTLLVPAGLPAGWLSATADITQVPEHAGLTPADLDSIDSVITGCAVAIAETGTIVLDAGPGQGTRRATLIPDHHVCVVQAHQVVAALPLALERLDPRRPLTWISGPSATSDIELDRVEGVHGPRTLEVVLLTD